MRFKIYLPTIERCRDLGIKHEGIQNRTLMWLLGVSFGMRYAKENRIFTVELVRPNFCVVVCNDPTVMEDVAKHLSVNGFTVVTHPEGIEIKVESPYSEGNFLFPKGSVKLPPFKHTASA